MLERTVHNTLLSRPGGLPHERGGLDRLTFSTLDVPRPEQFEQWHDLIAPLADVMPVSPGPGFLCEEVVWNLGSIALVRSKTAPFRYRRTARHIRTDSIDHWVIQHLHKGRMSWRGDTLDTTGAGALNVESLRGELAGDATQMDALFLFVPREFCSDSANILDGAEGRALTSGLSLLLADYLLDLERRLPMLTVEELPSVLATTRTMLLACLAPSAERLAEAQRPIDATLLERARRLIQEELVSTSLSVDMLCKRLGVSRSRLYRLFEPAGGIAHYIRARRLLDAHISLADTHDQRRIADIAADRGFLDAAEFSRAFKREFGYTPSDVRREASHGPMRPPIMSRVEGAGGDLAGLLRGLRPMPQW